MNKVAIARAHGLPPGNCWDKGFGDLVIAAAAPAIAGLAIDGVFCAGANFLQRQADPAAIVADRLGLKPDIALSLDCADISGAAALYSAWQHVRTGLCRSALVIAAAKVSDVSEAERLGLMDRTLDQDADVARGIDFATQAGLLAGHYCRERGKDAGIFAETTAANLAAWARHSERPAPTSAELRRDLPVSPPLVRSDFAQLLDGAFALVLTAADQTDRPRAVIEEMSSGTDIVSVWERRDPLAFSAVERAMTRIIGAGADTPSWLEIDAGVSIVQRLAEEAVARGVGTGKRRDPRQTELSPRVNLCGGAQGRGRVFGASALYQLADICEIAARGDSALLLAVAGLGSHVFAVRLSGGA